MLARTADNLYWMSRYMERIDFIIKILLVGFSSAMEDQFTADPDYNWKVFQKMFYTTPQEDSNEALDTQVFKRLTFYDSFNSLKELISKARENARGVQEHISKEVWESINRKYHFINNTNPESLQRRRNKMEFLFSLFDDNLRYGGVLENTNHRGEGWNFMMLGKFFERCNLTLGMAEENFKNPKIYTDAANNILFWKVFLLNLSAFELYLKDYRSGDNTFHVLEMLVFNKKFTRSLSYTIGKIHNYIMNIVEENSNPNSERIKREIGMMYAKINYSDLEQLKKNGPLQFFSDVKSDLFRLSQNIGQTFFLNY